MRRRATAGIPQVSSSRAEHGILTSYMVMYSGGSIGDNYAQTTPANVYGAMVYKDIAFTAVMTPDELTGDN